MYLLEKGRDVLPTPLERDEECNLSAIYNARDLQCGSKSSYILATWNLLFKYGDFRKVFFDNWQLLHMSCTGFVDGANIGPLVKEKVESNQVPLDPETLNKIRNYHNCNNSGRSNIIIIWDMFFWK
jgi:hypothetical protein